MDKIIFYSLLILTSLSYAQNIILKHNIGNNIVDQTNNFTCGGGGVNCACVFVLEDFAVTGKYTITSGSFAIQESISAFGYGIVVNVYSIDQNFPASFDNATLLGSSDIIDIPFINNTISTFDFLTEIIVSDEVEIILVEASLSFQNQNVFIGGTSNSNDFSWFKSRYASCVGVQNQYQTTVDQNRENLNYYTTVSGNNVLGMPDFVTKSITIIPNPVKDVISIKLPNESDPGNIITYDLSGKKVLDIKSKQNAAISNLRAGIYFMNVLSSNECKMKKFIKL